ncbi:hypothetical protein [Bradyrhizobium sp. CCGUVB1N3]|nr:hypothetical protein [Bradyrhizobium sp. CCGUVB1N3]
MIDARQPDSHGDPRRPFNGLGCFIMFTLMLDAEPLEDEGED